MRNSTQLKAHIRNLSKENSVSAEVLLRNFMLERLLERIALSKYRNKFILKGGMLVAAIVGIDARATMDMDTAIRGFDLSETELIKIFNDILDININDGVIMTLEKIETIRDQADYPGKRASINAIFDKTRQSMKVDITTGDRITPKEIDYSFKLLLEDRSISILAYNIETVFAEKMETILSRGTTTTRMRDYYDIYILSSLYERQLEEDTFKKAFIETTICRGSYENIKTNGFEYIEAIEKSPILSRLWNQYQSKNDYASEVQWTDVLDSMKKVFYEIFMGCK